MTPAQLDVLDEVRKRGKRYVWPYRVPTIKALAARGLVCVGYDGDGMGVVTLSDKGREWFVSFGRPDLQEKP